MSRSPQAVARTRRSGATPGVTTRLRPSKSNRTPTPSSRTTAPGVAFALGARSADPLAMYLSDVMTVPASLAGLPALSVPAGLAPAPDDAAARLPVGLQLVGPQLAEERLIAVAAAFEHATTHAGLRPPQEVAR